MIYFLLLALALAEVLSKKSRSPLLYGAAEDSSLRAEIGTMSWHDTREGPCVGLLSSIGPSYIDVNN